MEDHRTPPNRPVNPRRRKRSKMQNFTEAYLPVIIAALVLVLIIVFIISAVAGPDDVTQPTATPTEPTPSATSEPTDPLIQYQEEVENRLTEAAVFAADYDYENALKVLKAFSGELSKFPVLTEKIAEYESALQSMVAWDDPAKVANLSFQLLMADPARSFTNADYGYAFNRNFITTEEFAKILQQLYENGYILVDMDDIIAEETNEDGAKTYKAKTLYLPQGKKPLMLTQNNVNYSYYLIDSDDDKLPDAGGSGFASKLIWDGEKFTSEMVDATGNTVQGNYDMVPILEAFIAENPDFSYRGAKATLALTGYNGLFGYRTHFTAINIFGEVAYQKAVSDVTALVKALRDHGYTIACYTYENLAYGESGYYQVQTDLMGWTTEVTPILSEVDILVYAQNSDISTEQLYSGDKFNMLQNAGFRYYLGFCTDGQSWATVTDSYVRIGRLMVTGSNLAHHADWFENLFDPTTVLDPSRGNIPR